MSCCGGNCDRDGARPRQAMLVNPAAVQSLVKNLFGVVITGVKNISWPSEDAAQLAAMIADMVIENAQLKKLLGQREKERPTVSVADDVLRLAFGPGGGYTLQLPAGTAEQRKALAAALEAAAAALRSAPKKMELPGQMSLPFQQ